jgi:hypothetical protein
MNVLFLGNGAIESEMVRLLQEWDPKDYGSR